MPRSLLLLIVLLVSVNLAGCPAQDPTDELGRIIPTDIPAGTYVGELAMNMVVAGAGQSDSKSDTMPYEQVIDANGLPLIEPGAVVPRTGAEIPIDLQGNTVTTTVQSVETTGTRLTITYSVRMSISGLALTGDGTWVYEYTAPDTLVFTDELTAVSAPVFGTTATLTYSGSATLTRE